jgi:hypothetical protein
VSGCFFATNKGSTLRYIRRITAVSLPADLAIISEFDQGELEAGGKYLLEKKDIKAFLAENPFIALDEPHQHIIQFNQYNQTDQIPFSDSVHLMYFSGCKTGNSWLFTLNVITGELWIEVQYPDLGGQGPSCN